MLGKRNMKFCAVLLSPLWLTALGGAGAVHAEEDASGVAEAPPEPAAGEKDAAVQGNAYQFSFDGLMVDTIPMSDFSGDVVLVVNTASRCGFTPQYSDLQTLYEQYKDRGLVVLGVPSNDFGAQEPGSAEEIEEFCRLNYGVTFPMAAKSAVVGSDAHPFYLWAAEAFGDGAVPRWNFHKILIARNGAPVGAFPSRVRPSSDEMIAAVEGALSH
jgi:glutathione peroxidase